MFKQIVKDSGFIIKQETLCDFPLLTRISNLLGIPPFLNKFVTTLDLLLSQIFRWNINYHPEKMIDKFRSASIAFILEKR